ncbi:MAG: phosphatase PAP2 family protein [Eubacteriales bacterium]|nr:phosphatase PAP2 family protein [Eubacteriales bacterium]
MKSFYEKYRHGVPMVIFMAVYLLWFCLLEQRTNVNYMVVHMNIDDYIPFCELFVVPYLLWFVYVPAVVVYLFFKDKDGYWNSVVFLCTGMLIFLIISTFIPNIQHLRLRVMPRDNVFTRLVWMLWRTDTPTNLFPSIHVYNSLGAHFAVLANERLSGKKWIRRSSLCLCVSIILSTMFIKQHSMFDVLTALIMGTVMYAVVYSYNVVSVYRYQAAKRSRKRAGIG